MDNETTELLFGGGAGGGKSYLGCMWLIFCCFKYPESRWLMGRAVLKDLRQSTLLTLFKLLSDFGIKKDIDYRYQYQAGIISFTNGSEIYLKDLATYPSDPEFDSLGSTEYTGAFIDEASQISFQAKQIVMTRIRYRLDELNLVPKLLIASNPYKNFLYTDFYKLSKEGTLPKYRKFLKSLVTDNPYISKHYIENLKKADKNRKERLLYGNWEYDDDPAKLFEYDDIVNMFHTTCDTGAKYIVVDVARFGDDRTTISYWEGLYLKNLWIYRKKDTKFIEEEIQRKAKEFQVKSNHILIDEDGIGGGVVDHIPNCKGFVNNARAIDDKSKDRDENMSNYSNLKAQCSFYLADFVREGKIGIFKGVGQTNRDLIIEEFEQIKQKDPDKDGKLKIVGKDEIKENIGRSTDLYDVFMMRMFFEIKSKVTGMLEFV